MTKHELVFAFAVGGALIAAWLYARVGGRAPQSARGIVGHAFAALATTALVPLAMKHLQTQDSPARALAALFVLVLPMFVYNFVTWLWLLRLLQRHLRVG